MPEFPHDENHHQCHQDPLCGGADRFAGGWFAGEI